MSVVMLIGSWRLRAVLAWLAHQHSAKYAGLSVVGALVLLDVAVPGWLRAVAGSVTLALVAGQILGDLLHGELDDAGVPCRWCDAGYQEVAQ